MSLNQPQRSDDVVAIDAAQHVKQLLNMITKLSGLLGLTEEECKELFAMVSHYVIASLDKQTRHRQSWQKDYGGRPRDKDNDWAFHQVYELHRPPCEVYQEWLARRKEHGKLIQLADPYDSFKKALNARRKKGKKGD